MYRTKRVFKNSWLKTIAMENGLKVGSKIAIHERSILKDLSYITREVRKGTVIEMYPYMFRCKMDTGTIECFRYNEFLGDESTLVRLKE